MGNPPYSANSANYNKWTDKLLKEDVDGAQSYYEVDGKGLGESNPKLLQDDYVKFLRFAQWKIQKAGKGVIGMITNHSFIENVTFRGMRQSLMKSFDQIYILNLHGNALKKEKTPEGGKDDNVFDIRQGVSISLFIKEGKQNKEKEIFYSDVWGLRREKYETLNNIDIKTTNWEKLKPESPWYFLIPRNTSEIEYYNEWTQLTEIFPINSTGIKTHRDDFIIDFSKDDLKTRINTFKNLQIPNDVVRKAFDLKDNRDWKLSEARKSVAKDLELADKYTEVLYRPFDKRFILYLML